MKILVTGVAGFIGMHVARRLLERGDIVVGIDNLNDYYDVRLKTDRLKQLAPFPNFRFIKLDLADRAAMEELFAQERFRRVINLAAQPGVRYSLKNPHAYIDSNIVGFLNVLEGCRHQSVEHLVYASSSSVYGNNPNMPFSIHDNVDHPISLYAATKKSNELMAHTYSHLFGFPTTGLRFFTAYGPWGRPDMSPSLFAEAILAGRPIDVFNHGKMQRDFTYIDDIVEGVVRVLDTVAPLNPPTTGEAPNQFDDVLEGVVHVLGQNSALKQTFDHLTPFRLYNIGNNQPVALMTFIETIEMALGKKAVKNMLPMQAGDVLATCADIEDLRQAVDFAPRTPLSEGIAKFVAWFKEYYSTRERLDLDLRRER